MLRELPSVTSERAAEIVDIGYEGFRSYLKRGLLGRVGSLPGFHAPQSTTYDDPAPRRSWRKFSFADLCLMRLAKVLMNHGFSFESANSAVSQQVIWDSIRSDEYPTHRYLLLWPPYIDHTIYDENNLDLLTKYLKENKNCEIYTLINLFDIQKYVAEKLQT